MSYMYISNFSTAFPIQISQSPFVANRGRNIVGLQCFTSYFHNVNFVPLLINTFSTAQREFFITFSSIKQRESFITITVPFKPWKFMLFIYFFFTYDGVRRHIPMGNYLLYVVGIRWQWMCALRLYAGHLSLFYLIRGRRGHICDYIVIERVKLPLCIQRALTPFAIHCFLYWNLHFALRFCFPPAGNTQYILIGTGVVK